MALREIPATAVEVQTGLWADEKVITNGVITRVKYNLYSSEGYCFYIPENNLDENGDLLPENQRTYYQYLSSACTTIEQVNARYVSVPVQDGYEIASASTNTETI